jgi:hypothetical protein
MKYFLTISLLLLVLNIKAQQSGLYDNYHLSNSTQVPTSQPLSDDELKLLAYSQYEKQQTFKENYTLAYAAFNNKNYYDCITYTDNALNTGLVSKSIYYLRGLAYLALKETKYAKKNFRKAKKLGDLKSEQILRNWKQFIKTSN